MEEDIVTETGTLEKAGEPEICRSQPGGYPKDLARKAQSRCLFLLLLAKVVPDIF